VVFQETPESIPASKYGSIGPTLKGKKMDRGSGKVADELLSGIAREWLRLPSLAPGNRAGDPRIDHLSASPLS